MKRKNREAPRERNVFAVAVLFRKAGAHDKTNKAKRRAEKQRFLRDLRDDRNDPGSTHCFDRRTTHAPFKTMRELLT